MEMREFDEKAHLAKCVTLLLFPSFVSEVLHLYYKDDDAVVEDEEIQAFVKDVRNFGMQDFESCGERSANHYYLLLALQNSILLPGPMETGKTEFL